MIFTVGAWIFSVIISNLINFLSLHSFRFLIFVIIKLFKNKIFWVINFLFNNRIIIFQLLIIITDKFVFFVKKIQPFIFKYCNVDIFKIIAFLFDCVIHYIVLYYFLNYFFNFILNILLYSFEKLFFFWF